jgi:hypothetical protein
MGPFVTDIAARHLSIRVTSLVAGHAGLLRSVTVDTNHHRAGGFARHGIKAVAYSAMAVAAEQVARLAVHNLVLHQLVGDPEFIARKPIRQVSVTDDALLGLCLADVANESPVTFFPIFRFTLTEVTGHTAQRAVGRQHRLGLDEIRFGVDRVLSTGLQGGQREMASMAAVRDAPAIANSRDRGRRFHLAGRQGIARWLQQESEHNGKSGQAEADGDDDPAGPPSYVTKTVTVTHGSFPSSHPYIAMGMAAATIK